MKDLETLNTGRTSHSHEGALYGLPDAMLC